MSSVLYKLAVCKYNPGNSEVNNLHLLNRNKETVKNKVYEFRKDNSITQQALADEVGVTRQTIISIEKGNYLPSVLLALKIAKFFNVTLEEIFLYEENK